MLKTCQSCNCKCHIRYSDCPTCHAPFVKKRDIPKTPSELERKYPSNIWSQIIKKVHYVHVYKRWDNTRYRSIDALHQKYHDTMIHHYTRAYAQMQLITKAFPHAPIQCIRFFLMDFSKICHFKVIFIAFHWSMHCDSSIY